MDNKQRWNNICLKVLKEGLEGDNLVSYLEEFSTRYIGSDHEEEVKIKLEVQIRADWQKVSHQPRDVLVKFMDWKTKVRVWML